MLRLHPALVLTLLACGSSTPGPTDPGPDTPDDGAGRRASGVTMDADIGALNESQVLQTFQKSQGELMRCFEKGAGRVPFIGGRVRFHLRVDRGGGVKSAHLKDSTLGDRGTEECMLGVVRQKSWPAPQGGKEGIAETEFTFDPSNDVRSPVAWSAADAGKSVSAALAAVSKCRESAGAGPLKATVYVETDGSVLSVGVAGEGAQTEEAAPCVVSALKEVKFNSPGSYAAKMTLGE